MALKKPVVQFDLKEARRIAKDASMYADWNDLNDFADKIILLLRSPELCATLGERGYAIAENELNWAKESQKLVDFYKLVTN